MSSLVALVLAASTSPAREDPAQVAKLLTQVGAVVVIVGLMAVVFGWIMTQGHRGTADAKRLRSIVLFHAIVPVDGLGDLSALVDALVASLRGSGLDVGHPESTDAVAHVPLELEHDQFVVHLRRAPEGFLLQLCDRSAANRPAAESLAAPVERKRTRRVLVALDAAVRALPTASQIRWHKREHVDAGDFSAGAHDAIA